jgi:DNA replication and repair protein RecF
LLNAQNSRGAKDQLEVWDETAAAVGCRIVKTRRSYTEKLGEAAAQWYGELSCHREKLSLTYRAAGGEDGQTEEPQGYLQALKLSRESDWARGFTTVGPHRDDIEIKIDGKPARVYASQGQRRTAVLALKMAECAMMEKTLGESPIMLLDDVLSELDEQRRSVLLRSLENRQSFITGCDDAHINNVSSVYCMKAGKLRQIT